LGLITGKEVGISRNQIHGAEDVNVVGQAEPTVEGRPKIVRQFDSQRRLWMRFEQIDRLPDCLAQVGAIDLVDV
jgi:hypothetical protein